MTIQRLCPGNSKTFFVFLTRFYKTVDHDLRHTANVWPHSDELYHTQYRQISLPRAGTVLQYLESILKALQKFHTTVR